MDRADFPHVDFRCGADSLPMFESGSAEVIYSSHMLEYFDRREILPVLAEWNRLLCPGGLLRLAVPDFEALVGVYLQNKNLESILGPVYGRMEIVGTGTTIYHKTAYDFASLEKLLGQCGFRDVRRYDWRETIHQDIDDHSQAYIPHMDKVRGKLVSLNVECNKPLG